MAVAPRSNWFKANWPYLLGAVAVHAFVAGLFGLTMVRMQRDAPPPTLAIEAVVIDQNQLAQPERPKQDLERARQQAAARAAEEQRRQAEEAAAKREQAQRAEQERLEAERLAQEREQERIREEQVAREREAQRIAQERAAEEQRKRQEEAERQRKLEAERQAKLEAERKRVEEIQRKQREREEAERRRIAAENEARERALQEQLAAEEGLMQARSSAAMGQYVAMIQQHVERRWIRPPSARPGIACEVNVTQSQSGAVLRVQVGECNGDFAVRQSIENAVQKASPLPLPSDMRLFDRNLRFIFKPAD